MFRRHPSRRALGRIRRRLRAPEELILANQMMESGNYQGAAEQFEAIARAAESRGGRHAPQLYLQAGLARILAGQNEVGLVHLQKGLSLLARRSEWRRFYRASQRMIAELNQRGLKDEADQISAFLNSTLPSNFSLPSIPSPARRPILPTHCPSCGAALRPDEVEWLDDLTAECAYCGSPVREEN